MSVKSVRGHALHHLSAVPRDGGPAEVEHAADGSGSHVCWGFFPTHGACELGDAPGSRSSFHSACASTGLACGGGALRIKRTAKLIGIWPTRVGSFANVAWEPPLPTDHHLPQQAD